MKAAVQRRGGSKHASSFIVASLVRNAVRLTALPCPSGVAQQVLLQYLLFAARLLLFNNGFYGKSSLVAVKQYTNMRDELLVLALVLGIYAC